MSEINDLRERVEAAEARFGLMDEQQSHYSERLIGLIETIEAQLADARGEIEKQIAENQRLAHENEELRTMLHSVLRSIEEKTFTQTLQNIEARVSALVAQAPAAAPLRSDGNDGAEAAADQTPEAEASTEIQPEGESEPEIDAMVEGEEFTAEDAADSVIIDPSEELAADGSEDTPAEAAAETGEADGEDLAANAEMPESVAFEDADPEEIAAEAEAEAAEEAASAIPADETMLEESLAEEAPGADLEGQDDDAEAGAAEADAGAAEPEAAEETGTEDEAPAPPDLSGDGEEVFSAMNLLNADNEDFAAEPEAQADAAADVPEMAEEIAAEEPAAEEPEAESPEPDTAADADSGLSDAVAERLADEVPEEMAESVAPTVKEIIRRVGDLARELERAEAARRSTHTAQAPVGEGAGEAEAATPETTEDHPALDQVANA